MNSGVPVLLFNNVFNFKSISTHNSVISFCFPWKNILYCSLSVLTSSNALLYLQRLLLHSHTFKESAFCDSPMGFPHSSVGKKSTCNAGDPGLIPGLGRSPRKRDRTPTPVFLGFPCGSDGKESVHSVGDLGSIPGLGRSPGEGKGYSLQYSGL